MPPGVPPPTVVRGVPRGASVGAAQSAALARLVDGAAANAVHTVVESLTTQFARAVLADTKYKQQQLISLAQVFERGLQNSARLQQIHQRVGAAAQRSVIASYGQLVTGQEGAASRSHYRAGRSRLADGVMRRALGRGDFFEAGPDGLRFINITMLDDQAAHWHRLAFGAAGRGRGSAVRYTVTLGNVAVAAIGYDEPPSPSFRMPPGLWITPQGERVAPGANPNGSDLFFPQSERPSGVRGRPSFRNTRQTSQGPQTFVGAMSRGIVGRDFFAAGVRRIAEEFPRGYLAYYEEIFDEWVSGRGPLTRITVPVGAPKPLVPHVRRR